ncbi:proteasome subunit alpha-3 [Acrasis kona]|uniref:Proteasome subunit alpha type n=1 Tax=Acrasis kona TaxID=1008807 RepID=A0AAW2ZFT0_9EUKA
MSSNGTGYDLSVTTYSPDGRLFQIEYAQKAVENSGTVIGVACKDGVVLGVEKLIESKLMERNSNQRIFNVDYHVGIALAGWKPDTRQLVNKARKESQDYQSFYGTKIPAHVLTERVAMHVHQATMYWHLRPYGVCALISAYDEQGPQLFMVEPSGTSWGYHGCAVGKAKQAARTEIEKLKFTEMTTREAVKEVARIIHLVHDPVKDKDFELELSWVCDESKRVHQLVPKEVKEEAEQYAKEANKDDDDDDDEEDEDEELVDSGAQ